MKKPIACLYCLVGLLGGPAIAADAAAPLDVAALAWREVQCRDWSNMTITDAATDHRVEHALFRLRCGALVADMAALRRKYAQSPSALDAAGDSGP